MMIKNINNFYVNQMNSVQVIMIKKQKTKLYHQMQ